MTSVASLEREAPQRAGEVSQSHRLTDKRQHPDFVDFCRQSELQGYETFLQRTLECIPENHLHLWLCYKNGKLCGADHDLRVLQTYFHEPEYLIFRYDRVFPEDLHSTPR